MFPNPLHDRLWRLISSWPFQQVLTSSSCQQGTYHLLWVEKSLLHSWFYSYHLQLHWKTNQFGLRTYPIFKLSPKAEWSVYWVCPTYRWRQSERQKRNLDHIWVRCVHSSAAAANEVHIFSYHQKAVRSQAKNVTCVVAPLQGIGSDRENILIWKIWHLSYSLNSISDEFFFLSFCFFLFLLFFLKKKGNHIQNEISTSPLSDYLTDRSSGVNRSEPIFRPDSFIRSIP